MRFSTTTFLTAALAGLSVAAPALSKRALVIIGYRVCSRAEGERLQSSGLFFNGGDAGMLGTGMSTSYNPGGYPADNPDDMFCVIRADSDAMNRVGKAWIPEYWQGVENHYDEGAVRDFIDKALDKGWNAAKTIRLGVLTEDETKELLIPVDLITDASMGFTVECFDHVEDLPEEEVDYDSFSGIEGWEETKEEDLPENQGDDDDDSDDDDDDEDDD